MKHLPKIAAALLLMAGPATAQTSWSWTGQNGGVIDGTTKCDRQSSETICSSSGTYNGPNGRVADWWQDRTITDGKVTGRRSSVGANGGERNATWSRVRQR